MKVTQDSIIIWGVPLKRLDFTGFTNVALFATVLFICSVAILHAIGKPVGLNAAFAACFTGALSKEVGLRVHESPRHLVLFIALAFCALICVRLVALFALAASGG